MDLRVIKSIKVTPASLKFNMNNSSTVESIKKSLENKEMDKCSTETRELASTGNSMACEIYGDMLMEGVWDTHKMTSDLITGNLLESVEFPARDPYLILPRDPVSAVEYYLKASENRDSARAKLEYCQKNGYAGLAKKEKLSFSAKLTREMKAFLDKNAKSSSIVDVESTGKFSPLPDFRPKINDPRTFMFREMAITWGTRSMYQFIGIAIIIFITCAVIKPMGLSDPFNALFFGLFTFGIPLIGHALFCIFYAERMCVPLCSCVHLQAAHGNNISEFDECLAEIAHEPFKTTPFLVRNVHKIKQIWLWLMFIISISLCATHGSDEIGKAIFFYMLTMTFPFLVVLIWEKRFQSIPKYFGIDPFFLQIYLMFLYLAILVAPWTLFDSDCYYEYEHSIELKGIEKDIMNLEITQKSKI